MSIPTDFDDLLDMQSAAGYVGCSYHTLRYRMTFRGLEASHRIAGRIFFTVADLDAHFDAEPLIADKRRRA